MINPDMIHSVKEVAGGWHVVQCGLPVDDVVHDTRDQASDRARYLNSVEEQYYPVLARVAQIVDALSPSSGHRPRRGSEPRAARPSKHPRGKPTATSRPSARVASDRGPLISRVV
jgi:hypothetical protein